MDASPSHLETVFLLLLFTIMFNSTMCNSKVDCNKEDMSTLLYFKQGVTDPAGLLSSWFPEKDCCQWTGVQCDNITGRVIELNLPCHIPSSYSDTEDKSHCLTGEFDLSLLDLEFLSYLDLSNNDFKAIKYNSMANQTCNGLSRSTPPHRCGNSSNLHYLDLSYNSDILLDNLHWISRLSSLQYLNLNDIDLRKEIDWLRSMTMLSSLQELHLESCQLQSIYPSLQYVNFTSLEVLDLTNNDFISELPNWLFNLSCDIFHIKLGHNHIHGQLPRTLSNLRSLKSLILNGNNLDGPISDWLGQFEHLENLFLSGNSFSGPIPTSLGNLSSLTELSLVGNELNGNLPESLAQLMNLEALLFAENPLTGIISERNFHSLSNLKHLSLASPALIFDFDPEWIPPFQLQHIELGFVHDKLPLWLFTQSSLKSLTIADSNASFEPHDKFWNFVAQHEALFLDNNSMHADMSNVSLNSKFTWLKSNYLKGGVPRLSENVVLLNLEDNYLSGSISPLLCHQMKGKSNLENLNIANNLLSGGLTDCWMNRKSLAFVYLDNNNLTGKIPHSMGFLPNLTALVLNDNKLFGDIPSSMKNCHKLWVLSLSGNKFSGAIPNWIGQSVKALLLRSNQFSGSIPRHICQLNSLKLLDFSNNRLSGQIPNCLHNMTAMVSDYASNDQFYMVAQVADSHYFFRFGIMLHVKGNELDHQYLMYVVDLSNNNLSGIVPSAIFNLTNLQSLNLSHNQLQGRIPQEIGNLKQLESLDLSSNWLSGEIPHSMSDLSFLGSLNLSFNNFKGEIPLGSQLQGFTALSYMGNPQLCGPPLASCTHDQKSYSTKHMGEDDDESEVHSWFYMGMGMGFAVGFWGVFGTILLNRTCRHAYFRFLNHLYTMVTQKINSAY